MPVKHFAHIKCNTTDTYYAFHHLMSENKCPPFIIILCDFDGYWLLPNKTVETVMYGSL